MSILTDVQMSRLLDIAYTSAHDGGIFQANTIFNAFLKENPKHAPSLIGLGLTSFMVNKFDEGETFIKKVLDENPNDADALAVLSLGYFVNNKAHEAKEIALKVSELSSAGKAGVLVQEILKEV